MEKIDTNQTNAIQKVLEDLHKDLNAVDTSLVTSKYGEIISFWSRDDFDEMKELAVLQVFSTYIALVQRFLDEFDKEEEFVRTGFESNNLFAVTIRAGEKAYLIAISRKEVREGLLYYHLDEAASRIEDYLS